MRRYKITEKRFYRIKHEASTPVSIEVFPTAKELALKYGVSRQTVDKIKDSPTFEYYKDYATQKTIQQVKMEMWGKK